MKALNLVFVMVGYMWSCRITILVLKMLGVCLLVCRYIIECDSCGVIYRSRKHWYGNPPPEQGAVRSENRHVWHQVCVCGHY